MDYDIREDGKYESELFGESGYIGSLFLYPHESREEAMRRELKESGISIKESLTEDKMLRLYIENLSIITEGKRSKGVPTNHPDFIAALKAGEERARAEVKRRREAAKTKNESLSSNPDDKLKLTRERNNEDG